MNRSLWIGQAMNQRNESCDRSLNVPTGFTGIRSALLPKLFKWNAWTAGNICNCAYDNHQYDCSSGLYPKIAVKIVGLLSPYNCAISTLPVSKRESGVLHQRTNKKPQRIAPKEVQDPEWIVRRRSNWNRRLVKVASLKINKTTTFMNKKAAMNLFRSLRLGNLIRQIFV